jgi:hypothetical protein
MIIKAEVLDELLSGYEKPEDLARARLDDFEAEWGRRSPDPTRPAPAVCQIEYILLQIMLGRSAPTRSTAPTSPKTRPGWIDGVGVEA